MSAKVVFKTERANLVVYGKPIFKLGLLLVLWQSANE